MVRSRTIERVMEREGKRKIVWDYDFQTDRLIEDPKTKLKMNAK